MRTLRFLAIIFTLLGLAVPIPATITGAETGAADTAAFSRTECDAAQGEHPAAAGRLFLAQAACPQGTLTCITYFCLNEGRCCLANAPYLSHCSCQCFAQVPTDCGSYSKCQR